MPQIPHDNPIPNPTTEVGRHAAELFAAVIESRERPQEARDARTLAANSLMNAKAAYHAEVGRGAREGIDHKAQKRLAVAVRDAEIEADHDVHGFAERVAHKTVREAEATYLGYVQQHRDDLLAEIEPAALELEDELTAFLEKGRPLHERWFELRQAAKVITHLAAGQDIHQELVYGSDAIPDAPAAPLPASYKRRIEPLADVA